MEYFQGEAIFRRIIHRVSLLHAFTHYALGTGHWPLATGANIPYINNRQAGLLLLNSILILNRRRFLSKYGLDDLNHMHHHHGAGDAVPLRAQIVGLLHAVQYLKVPIIACNIVTIVFEMLLGGT